MYKRLVVLGIPHHLINLRLKLTKFDQFNS